MGVPRLLKLKMASHSCSRPAVASAARPISSFLLAPSPAAAAALPRPAPLSWTAQPCGPRAAPHPAHPRVAAGRRFPGVAAMSSSTAGVHSEVGGGVGGHSHARAVPHPPAQGH
ncbi:hypothetical protein PR202_ga04614 [Eleusine coracana subsp. coracana]|uniref:Uncharacterized protein n=1 Tax=Eleusine coracana subsp. coracana TaxID=191504 RepID=A0AAV5BS29_ELECO|nr:hypothetical protein PR202_ga04614 [Eleusine coracana subsp. coracana]